MPRSRSRSRGKRWVWRGTAAQAVLKRFVEAAADEKEAERLEADWRRTWWKQSAWHPQISRCEWCPLPEVRTAEVPVVEERALVPAAEVPVVEGRPWWRDELRRWSGGCGGIERWRTERRQEEAEEQEADLEERKRRVVEKARKKTEEARRSAEAETRLEAVREWQRRLLGGPLPLEDGTP